MNTTRRIFAAVVVFLGGVAVGYFLPHKPPHDSGVPQAQSGTMLGKWEAKFKPPATVKLPDADPVVRFEFGNPKRYGYDSLTVTITNMTDNTYGLSYVLYGYDSKERRVSEDTSGLQIGGHESVVKEVWMSTYGGMPHPASYFIVAARADR